MTYPTRFDTLPTATWPRLRALLDPHPPGGPVINMTIGEPKHAFPEWVGPELAQAVAGFNKYPDNHGIPPLRVAIRDFLARRYGAVMNPDTQIMVLNGTREGLFNAVVALCPADTNILIPNPFYQVYTVAAMAMGAQSIYLPCTRDTGYLPDLEALDPATLAKTSAFFLCSPSNPQGAIASVAYWTQLLRLAEHYDFKIFADECYSEIYRDAPPPGALEVAQNIGANPERVVAFHSLSKRSNVPGLRSGFVASGPENIKRIKQLRAYAGCPVPEPVQHVSALLWADENHVVANRQLYCGKFTAADHIFAGINSYHSPHAGFFLWLPVNDGEQAAMDLWTKTGVRVLPGAYLGQTVQSQNPGSGYIRVALVAPKEETQRGLEIIRDCVYK
ncbi:MAG: aminotransferase class I/II-fold pyridoxal phosphate-dependent enzyme [Pseudomonadota bacterium]